MLYKSPFSCAVYQNNSWSFIDDLCDRVQRLASTEQLYHLYQEGLFFAVYALDRKITECVSKSNDSNIHIGAHLSPSHIQNSDTSSFETSMNIGQSTDNSNKDNHDAVLAEKSLYSIHKLLSASSRDYKI